jgi:hypothetical protein
MIVQETQSKSTQYESCDYTIKFLAVCLQVDGGRDYKTTRAYPSEATPTTYSGPSGSLSDSIRKAAIEFDS